MLGLVPYELVAKFADDEDPLFEAVRYQARTREVAPDDPAEPAVVKAICHLLKLRLSLSMATRSESANRLFLG